MAYLYRHIRLDKNEVFYIGIGSYQKKWKYARAYTTKNRNSHWKNIVKDCEKKFKVEIMLDNLSKEQAIEKEKEFILLYGRKDLKKGTLCNWTDGGEGILGLSEQSRKKISESRLGEKNPMYGKVQSKESLEKRAEKMRGENNPNYKKPLPEWHKEILRKAQLGKKQSAERIELRASKLRKKVLNTCTGEVFFSITELAHKIGKSPMQTTRRIKSGNYNLKFI